MQHKAKITPVTKHYKNRMIFFKIVSIALTFGPLIVCTIMGFIQATTARKLVLGISVILSIGLTFANVLFKYQLRSMIWILLLGVYVALQEVEALLIIMAICNIIDEVIVTPLAKEFKNKYTINKEIDAREQL